MIRGRIKLNKIINKVNKSTFIKQFYITNQTITVAFNYNKYYI